MTVLLFMFVAQTTWAQQSVSARVREQSRSLNHAIENREEVLSDSIFAEVKKSFLRKTYIISTLDKKYWYRCTQPRFRRKMKIWIPKAYASVSRRKMSTSARSNHNFLIKLNAQKKHFHLEK